jgi:RNA polymerase sigma-70 factor (ECF subfamily)
MPGEPEIAGLLALMLLHDSRWPARANDAGVMETLENQDRRLWNRQQISDGVDILKPALAIGLIGSYQIQAAISAVHSEAESHEATDWDEIALLYGKLYELQPSPIVLLNAAVALSFARNAEAGLGALEELEQWGELHGYQPYHAARADLSRRAGHRESAKAEYRKAIELSGNASQRKFLQNRLREMGA